jgi:hypothetical protein
MFPESILVDQHRADELTDADLDSVVGGRTPDPVSAGIPPAPAAGMESFFSVQSMVHGTLANRFK